ncbi:MAG: HNH endonuclease [Actinophytocola sp.]|uniref:HNH endonuclease n=1 Tax=Actinophytocola sp. TaxID=1872138 RepID=UPI003C7115D4
MDDGFSPMEDVLDSLPARRRPANPRPRVAPETMARIRLAVYGRDWFACVTCGWSPDVPDGYDGRYALGEDYVDNRGRARCRLLELDHIIPHLHGGLFAVDNLQALCNSCNARKGATHP